MQMALFLYPSTLICQSFIVRLANPFAIFRHLKSTKNIKNLKKNYLTLERLSLKTNSFYQTLFLSLKKQSFDLENFEL